MRLWAFFFLAGSGVSFLTSDLSISTIGGDRRSYQYFNPKSLFLARLADNQPSHRGSGRKDLYQPRSTPTALS